MYQAPSRYHAITEIGPEFSVSSSYRDSGRSVEKEGKSGREHISRLLFIRVAYGAGVYNADWKDPSVEVARRCTG
jgi:hypothetical protein